MQSLSQAGMLSTESAYPIRCANTASDRYSSDKSQMRGKRRKAGADSASKMPLLSCLYLKMTKSRLFDKVLRL